MRRLVHAALADPALPFARAEVENGIVCTSAPSPPNAKRLGHYAPARWTDGQRVAPELNLDATLGLHRGPVEITATVLHELAHHAQHARPDVFGKAARPPTHNKRWGALAGVLGLVVDLPRGYTRVEPWAPSVWAFKWPFMFEAPIPWRAGGGERAKGKMRLWMCACSPPIRLRVGKSEINVTCNDCGAVFVPAD